MKNNVIEVYRKDVYGLEKTYVADQKIAQVIGSLTGRKTLLNTDIKALETLGFTFKEVVKPTK